MEQLELEAMPSTRSEVAEYDYPERGIIVLRAQNNKTQLALTARPCEDMTGKVFTGQGPTGHYETLSDEDKKTMNYIITPETAIILTDGKFFDLDKDPIDKANWVWLRKHPYIAKDAAACKSSRDARFYIDDPVREAERRVSGAKVKDKARYLIQFGSNHGTLVTAATLLGNMGASAMSTELIQDWLLQQADVIPQMVLEALEPKNKEVTNARLLIAELMKRRLIQRGEGGLFRFGGETGAPLGHTEELILEFVLDPKNADVVNMMENAQIQSKNG